MLVISQSFLQMAKSCWEHAFLLMAGLNNSTERAGWAPGLAQPGHCVAAAVPRAEQEISQNTAREKQDILHKDFLSFPSSL